MPPLTAASLPASHAPLRRWVLSDEAELQQLRRGVYSAVTGRELPADTGLDDVPEKMMLVASELATNALRHGLPPTIVTLFRTAESYVLDVADHAPQLVPEYAERRPPGAGGLGLKLARDLAADLGWYVDDAGAGPVKHVWAQFPAV
ncbi:ATP-binding protein [Cryptosporangium sp. NPDC048952]|uniref:ATP-binding protein n=1 Tax=Cryptosporangium sp. NPDC048952 TaxID=3363961 RepID=UPI00372056FF